MLGIELVGCVMVLGDGVYGFGIGDCVFGML